jgi:hypothetical protein
MISFMDDVAGVPDDAELKDIITELARLNARAEEFLGDPQTLDDLINESTRLDNLIKKVLPVDPLSVVAWIMFSIIALSLTVLDL